jgi:hypothetical protein
MSGTKLFNTVLYPSPTLEFLLIKVCHNALYDISIHKLI